MGTHAKQSWTSNEPVAIVSIEELPLVLTVCDVAKLLGVGRTTAYAFVKSNSIKSIRVGNQIRIPRAEIIRFLGL